MLLRDTIQDLYVQKRKVPTITKWYNAENHTTLVTWEPVRTKCPFLKDVMQSLGVIGFQCCKITSSIQNVDWEGWYHLVEVKVSC